MKGRGFRDEAEFTGVTEVALQALDLDGVKVVGDAFPVTDEIVGGDTHRLFHVPGDFRVVGFGIFPGFSELSKKTGDLVFLRLHDVSPDHPEGKDKGEIRKLPPQDGQVVDKTLFLPPKMGFERRVPDIQPGCRIGCGMESFIFETVMAVQAVPFLQKNAEECIGAGRCRGEKDGFPLQFFDGYSRKKEDALDLPAGGDGKIRYQEIAIRVEPVLKGGGRSEIDLPREEHPVQYCRFPADKGEILPGPGFPQGMEEGDAVGVGDLSDAKHETS